MTLDQLGQIGVDEHACGNFSLAILAVSALDLCSEYAIRNNTLDSAFPQERGRTAIASLLETVNSLLQVNGCKIDRITHENKTINGALDHQALAHLVFANVVYHLCHCLVNHPYLSRAHPHTPLVENTQKLVKECKLKSLDHSMQLVEFLYAAGEAGYHINAPFYAYAMSVASSILILNLAYEKSRVNTVSTRLVTVTRKSVSMVQEWGRSWHHALGVVSYYKAWCFTADRLYSIADWNLCNIAFGTRLKHSMYRNAWLLTVTRMIYWCRWSTT